MRKLQNRKGFTLIELIIVIAIVAILAAILIPQFTGFQDKARSTQALTDAKSVATAIDAFNASNGAYPATANEADILSTAGLPVEGAEGSRVTSFTISADGAFTIQITVDSKVYQAGRSAGGSVGVTTTPVTPAA